MTVQFVVGMAVGHARVTSYGRVKNAIFTTVAKIHKNGDVVTADGRKFRDYGRERGDMNSPRYLTTAEQLTEWVDAEKRRLAMNARAAGLKRLVTEILWGQRTGFGDYTPITVEQRDALLVAVNALDVKQPEPVAVVETTFTPGTM